MLRVGIVNTLEILRFTSVGAYLGDDQDNDVLLPNKYLTEDMKEGDEIDVFLYHDSEDRIVATTQRPLIKLNEYAYLKVKMVTKFGAFLDWGLEKDLLVPFKEQTTKMEENGTYLIYMYLDEQTGRLVGTAKVKKHFFDEVLDLEVDDKVELLICNETDLGQNVIVNQMYSGLIYHNDISRPLKKGELTTGYVYTIREDGKLDIRLDKSGYEKIEPNADKIYAAIIENGGKLALTDKSHPDDIRERLGMSKKTFKKSLGNLYKARKVEIHDDYIERVD
ncbi:hypothetical protein SAMN05216474_1113 [Lishizhenia tianjinensis]|uniref:S1 motif domain-containing protein n=1 Tax=Lishizhenia tianjinensis TaxID=477690 RepID=A0A1I6YRH1_9FLAO|nr:S1-like domain-containing RNA-binding protein [Lishizhenia tianjinensis]SFT53033.1 hypothetical protein SAMN05216474_1113 [Lishizhenia tianjinensis]